tara:strand:+ start:743 stop:1447 length:705 start_codon:yes stop_codon:yes gene_type:complete
MALPKLNSVTYELNLPSTGQSVKYRPFLVKEQKSLMMAQESEDNKQIENAFASIIAECTFGEIDPYKMPMFDIEYVFLRLRAKSVGEKITLSLLCPDDEETRVEVEINLEDIDVQMSVEHDNNINITDNISIIMRYPNLSDMEGFNSKGQVESIFDMIKRCIHEIHDGEDIHQKVDMSEKELDEFVESMSTNQFEKVSAFFETMPKVQHVVEVKNPNTKKKGEVLIEGMQSFFE